jgi:hypothetical protein
VEDETRGEESRAEEEECTKGHDGIDDEAKSEKETDVGLDDEPILFLGEESRRGREMIRILSTILRWSSKVKEEVARHPTNGQHEEDANELSERGLAEHFLPNLTSRRRHKDLIVLTRASVVVVMTMRDSPGVVRNEKQRVADRPDDIVDNLWVREGLMATLVS